jgi:hypothetical protein
MTGVDYLLAQVNIGRMLAPLDSPQLADFAAALDPVNAAADAAPGFVWRLQTEDGNATAVQAFEWDRAGSAGVLVNMSVWESVEALAAYVYSDTHRQVLKRRRQWFERMAEAYAALWWIPAGHTPTTAEAEERVLHLREFGADAVRVHAAGVLPAAGCHGLRAGAQPGRLDLSRLRPPVRRRRSSRGAGRGISPRARDSAMHSLKRGSEADLVSRRSAWH